MDETTPVDFGIKELGPRKVRSNHNSIQFTPEDVRVLYFEPYARGRENRYELRSEEGVLVATIPFVKAVPGGPARRLLDVGAVRRVIDAGARRRVARHMVGAKVESRPVVVISNVFAIDIALALERSSLVYDCNDAHSAFPGMPGKYYILSNNHVLANSNMARIGDPVLQPGRYDGGTLPSDMIARLSRFVPIRFGGPLNLVDAAIAQADFHDIDREIYWVGYIKGVRTLRTINEIVQKTGRTTNYTTGKVTHLNAIVNVNYGGGRIARMARQIVTTNMSAGGSAHGSSRTPHSMLLPHKFWSME